MKYLIFLSVLVLVACGVATEYVPVHDNCSLAQSGPVATMTCPDGYSVTVTLAPEPAPNASTEPSPAPSHAPHGNGGPHGRHGR